MKKPSIIAAVALVAVFSLSALQAQPKKSQKSQPVAEEPQAKPDFGVVKYHNNLLSTNLQACMYGGRADFQEMRNGTPPGVQTQECVNKGKEIVKSAFDEVRKEFGNKKPPEELIDWRVEWAAAFDAALPQIGDIERVYLQKIGDAKRAVDRATAKLEIAME